LNQHIEWLGSRRDSNHFGSLAFQQHCQQGSRVVVIFNQQYSNAVQTEGF
jgi:hypothetical protein